MAIGKMHIGARAKGLSTNQRKQVTKLVKKTIDRRKEFKHHFVNVSSTINDTPFYQQILNDVDCGDNEILRDGDQIYAKRLHFRFNFISADGTNVLRLLFIWVNNDEAPTDAQILHFTANGVINCISPISILDPNVTVIKDYLFNPNDLQVVRHLNIDLKNRLVKYVDATGSNLGKGMLYVVAVSDSTAVTHPTLNYTSDFVFIDK